MFCCLCYFFLSGIQRCFLLSCPLGLDNVFYLFLQGRSTGDKFSYFSHIWECMYWPPFNSWRTFLLDRGFWVDSSFSIWKMCHFLLASLVSDEKSSLVLTALRGTICILLQLLEFCLRRVLALVALGLSTLGFSHLEYVCICLPSYLGCFQPLFPWVLFQLPSFSSPSRTLINTNVRPFVIAPQVPELCFTLFFQSIFSLLFRLSNFYCSSFQPLDPLSSPFCQ